MLVGLARGPYSIKTIASNYSGMMCFLKVTQKFAELGVSVVCGVCLCVCVCARSSSDSLPQATGLGVL